MALMINVMTVRVEKSSKFNFSHNNNYWICSTTRANSAEIHDTGKSNIEAVTQA